MDEEPVWKQLNISKERMAALMPELQSIIKAKETVGVSLLFIEESKAPQNTNEKNWMIFEVCKASIERRLMSKVPILAKVFGG